MMMGQILYRDLPPPKEPVKPKPIVLREYTINEIVAHSFKDQKFKGKRI